jgi:hypothetical protein
LFADFCNKIGTLPRAGRPKIASGYGVTLTLAARGKLTLNGPSHPAGVMPVPDQPRVGLSLRYREEFPSNAKGMRWLTYRRLEAAHHLGTRNLQKGCAFASN